MKCNSKCNYFQWVKNEKIDDLEPDCKLKRDWYKKQEEDCKDYDDRKTCDKCGSPKENTHKGLCKKCDKELVEEYTYRCCTCGYTWFNLKTGLYCQVCGGKWNERVKKS